MKKLITSILLILTGIIYYQCSYDQECSQIDWVGTYSINTTGANCTDSEGNNILPTELIIEAGSDASKIIFNGEEVEFTECEVRTSLGSMTIDFGENILNSNGCSNTYTKN